MSPKQWLALLCFFVSYLFFGASVFYFIERDLETERRAVNYQQRMDLHELVIANNPNNASHIRAIYVAVSELCNDDVHIEAPKKQYQWTFYHSFFFSFIVCSTIGYGNISPSSTSGKMFMIFYALIGIPVNGFLFAGLGDFFGKTFIGVYNRYKVYKMATNKNYMPMRFTLIGRILLYLMPGMVFFIFMPSVLFMYFEKWPYTTAIYYSFVTLTTIGFGDYVATFNAFGESEYGVSFYFYEAFVILWFIFGLGYLVMILSFIAKGMRSKRITRLERQLAGNLKATQQRIWHGVTKDVGYLRRILNELYMMKFKPVYTDDLDDAPTTLHRSASCPDLLLYRDPGTPPCAPRRRRALSVPYCEEAMPGGGRTTSMVRIQSDTDLSRIDRARTFDIGDDHAFGHEHILAQVVSALGSIRPADDDDGQSVLGLAMDYGPASMLSADGGGVHGFSDADILASELINSGWTLNQSADSGASYVNTTPKHRRARAASVFCVPTLGERGQPANASHEWTWSGQQAAQVQEFLRGKTKPRKQSLFRNLFVNSAGSNAGSTAGVAMTSASSSTDKIGGHSRAQSVSITMPGGSLPDMPATTTTAPAAPAASGGVFTKMNPFRRRILGEHGHRHSITGLDELTPQQYLERSARGRESRVSQPFGPRQYLQATARGRKSAFSVLTTAEPAHDDVLENTTIADLIRALEVVHTKVQSEAATAGGGSPLLSESPRRKMGVASLTPPKMSPTAAVRNAQARRGSLRPTPTYTTVFNSKLQQPRRRQSQHFSGGFPDVSAAAAAAAAAAEQPPPYDASPKPSPNRRFSVRPTNLSMAPGQVFQIPSVQAQSAVQRRLSLKPSPLVRGVGGTSSGRYVRGSGAPSQGSSLSPRMPRQQLQQLPEGVPTTTQTTTTATTGGGGRNVAWRATLVRTGRTRHGSMSELNEEERNERKRSDSK